MIVIMDPTPRQLNLAIERGQRDGETVVVARGDKRETVYTPSAAATQPPANAITLTPEQAKDPRAYRRAREQAERERRPLVIGGSSFNP